VDSFTQNQNNASASGLWKKFQNSEGMENFKLPSSSAQNLRGISGAEQQLRSPFIGFTGNRRIFCAGTFCASVRSAIDRRYDVAPADETKNQNTNYPREENVR